MKSLNEKKRYTLLLVLLCLACVSLFLLPDTMLGHDTSFHILRIKSLAESIRHGKWFPAIFPDFYDNYGYGLPLFYCNAFLYLPAILTVLGISLFWSYKIMMILICISTLTVTYYSIEKITRNDFCAFVTSALYVGSSYFASDFIERGAVGELFGYALFPLAFLGLYRNIFGDYKKNYPLIICFLGICFAHNLSLVMYAVVFILFIIFNISCYRKEPKRLLYLFFDSIIVILLASAFLLPFLEQEIKADFYSSVYLRTINPSWRSILIRNFFIQTVPTTYSYVPVLGITMIMPFGLWFFCVKISSGLMVRLRNLCILISIICMFMCTGHFPYERLDPLLNFIQFPWRWFMPITMLLAFSTGELLNELFEKYQTSLQIKMIVSVGLCLLCVGQFMFRSLPTVKEFRENSDGETTGKASGFFTNSINDLITTDELYLNANTNIEDWNNNRDGLPHPVSKKDNVILLGKWEYSQYTLSYSEYDNGEGIEIPLTYYYGYKAYDDSGEEIPVIPSERGLIQVNPFTKSGNIIIRYEKTFIQKTAPIISFATLLLLVFLNKFRKIKE